MDTHELQAAVAAVKDYVDRRLALEDEIKMQVITNKHEADDFVSLARTIAISRNQLSVMRDAARGFVFRTGLDAVFRKANVSAAGLADPNWAGSLAEYVAANAGFLASIENTSVFDAIFAATHRAPFNTIVGASTFAITGTETGGGQSAPLSAVSLDSTQFTPTNVVAMLVLSEEIARQSTPDATAFCTGELQNAVSRATNAVVIRILNAAVGASHTSAGTSAANVRTDLGRMVDEIDVSPSSSLLLLVARRSTRVWPSSETLPERPRSRNSRSLAETFKRWHAMR